MSEIQIIGANLVLFGGVLLVIIGVVSLIRLIVYLIKKKNLTSATLIILSVITLTGMILFLIGHEIK